MAMADGGVEVIDHGMRRILAELERLDGIEVRVGFQGDEGKAFKDVRDNDGSIDTGPMTVATIATIHEFGTARIPQRSFLRATLQENRGKIQDLQRRYFRQVVAGGRTAYQVANELGLRLAAAVTKKIVDLKTPPLAASTKRKRFLATGDSNPNPLVDTGQLKNSVTHIVARRSA